MNIFLENTNLNSNSGPNYFARKLVKYLGFRNVLFEDSFKYDLKLTFIESHHQKSWLPMIHRLDGIYFNANFDCEKMNSNIKRTYENSQGVVFQTEFNKNLIFEWFGPHDNVRIINNGADILSINELEESVKIKNKFKEYDNIWSCASHWHSFKRLRDNIDYFLNFSGENDCLVVAGQNPDYHISHPRIFYVGNLEINDLLTLYKISKYFIHLAYLDHCPNVVIDARACGCQVICSSSGGTKEVAGKNAIVVGEDPWDFSFLNFKEPPKIDFDHIDKNVFDSEISMNKAAKKYYNFFTDVVRS